MFIAHSFVWEHRKTTESRKKAAMSTTNIDSSKHPKTGFHKIKPGLFRESHLWKCHRGDVSWTSKAAEGFRKARCVVSFGAGRSVWALCYWLTVVPSGSCPTHGGQHPAALSAGCQQPSPAALTSLLCLQTLAVTLGSKVCVVSHWFSTWKIVVYN